MSFDIEFYGQTSLPDAIARAAEKIARRQVYEAEVRCFAFLLRNPDLSIEDITLVYYKGKYFPQWTGAVPRQ